MKKSFSILFAIMILSAVIMSACSGGGGTASSDYQTPPAEYAGMTDPVSGDSAAIAAGKDIYEAKCATCHGPEAKGDGPAGSALDPKPSNLVVVAGEASDAYMYWRIAEGGAMDPFNSSMPPHKSTMSEDEIWQVISYLKSLN